MIIKGGINRGLYCSSAATILQEGDQGVNGHGHIDQYQLISSTCQRLGLGDSEHDPITTNETAKQPHWL